MKRRGGDGGRTMVLDMKDGEKMEEARMEMEDLCSKLMSLVPQEYHLESTSQGSSDLPSQLMQAATYIQDLRDRVEELKQRRDDCYSKIQQLSPDQDVRVKLSGPAHFDVNLTTSSENRVEFYKVIRTIEQDRCVEIVEASSCLVDHGKIAHTIKCRARRSEAVMDASMVAARLRRLLTASLAKT